MWRLAPIGALAAAAVALFASTASAAPGIQYGIQDDAWIQDGPGTLEHRLDFVKALGVTTVRFGIHWDKVAPTRPARALASSDPRIAGPAPTRSSRDCAHEESRRS